MVRTLKGCSVFDLLDALYIGAYAPTLADALKNLKSNTFHQTAFGTIALDGVNGPKPDGISGYTDTGYNPTTSGGQLDALDLTMGAWLLTEGQSAGYDMGCGSLASLRAQARSATDTRNARACNSTAITAASTTALGEIGVRRTGNVGSFIRDGSGANTTNLTVPAGEISPNGNLTFHKNSTAFASRAHAIEFFGAYQPSDMYGVGHRARARFMVELGLV
ncbi:hypothetical protein HLI18_15645 [Rhizobium laguerreae]|uniref:hypothetical protein n=1 Tax=Rhizobium TaxID=379 RepID=UPI00138A4079|nr:hypothetical protein [Rhizobium laguerreae]NDK52653.1 hypothetical protein [Rhizobium laguerreae]NNG71332.1 hypothetical protein [Rhizobium laguerreae]NNH59099.1 hypothetical protein [Rhizobium laguerreae]